MKRKSKIETIFREDISKAVSISKNDYLKTTLEQSLVALISESARMTTLQSSRGLYFIYTNLGGTANATRPMIFMGRVFLFYTKNQGGKGYDKSYFKRRFCKGVR